MSDAPLIIPLLNDPRVYTWLLQLPFPYLPEDAEYWQKRITSNAGAVLRELEESANDKTLKIVGGCPVRSIREVADDGSDIYLGDVGIARCGWAYVVDEDERKRLEHENYSRSAGDPGIVWAFGG